MIRKSLIRLKKMSGNHLLCLFDVDGTLTVPRKSITEDMREFLFKKVLTKADVALVGGSDYKKISEQMGGENAMQGLMAVFSENGLIVHQNGREISRTRIQDHVGEEALQKFINFSLGYMSKLTLPVKRGTFIEFRTGLINVCPVGRSCSQEERDEFDAYDKEHRVREKFVAALQKEFPTLGLQYIIGGQISIDVFPTGWDKTYCLRQLPTTKADYREIHFFGDKTEKGGNDHELFMHESVIGHKVTSPDDTKRQLSTLLGFS